MSKCDDSRKLNRPGFVVDTGTLDGSSKYLMKVETFDREKEGKGCIFMRSKYD